MTPNEYQDFCKTVAVYPERHQPIGLLYTVLGLSNESGEVAGKIKKLIRDKNSHLDDEYKMKIISELGDAQYYLAMCADEIDVTLEEVMKYNVEKLTARKENGTIQGDGDNR